MSVHQPFRVAVAFTLILLLLLIPTVRIAVLMRGTPYREATAKQSLCTVTLYTERGTFYDRNGVRLTGRKTSSADFTVGDTVYTVSTRTRYSSLASHLIGYPTAETESGYTGLEAAFDTVLSRYTGHFSVSYAVNAAGQPLENVPQTAEDTLDEARGGVLLTLDASLQAFAEEQLLGLCGAVVVLSVDGDILALASAPGFEAESLASSLTESTSPLLNRALCAYDVGSVFKTVVSASALENGFSPDLTYDCTGSITIGDVCIHCHNRSGHGTLDLEGALIHSCNPYFIHLASLLGATKLLETAGSMGFGEPITLAKGVCSKSGNLPSEADLRVPAALSNFAIGQGTFLATPLQVAAAVNSIATGGVYVTPRLLLGETDGYRVTPYADGRETRRVMKDETASLLLADMTAVFTKGSLSPYNPIGGAAGKTSTAQTGITASDGHKVYEAWLCGVYPAENPQYTVAVLVEDGDSGSSSCGPIFQSVCNYLERNAIV